MEYGGPVAVMVVVERLLPKTETSEPGASDGDSELRYVAEFTIPDGVMDGACACARTRVAISSVVPTMRIELGPVFIASAFAKSAEMRHPHSSKIGVSRRRNPRSSR